MTVTDSELQILDWARRGAQGTSGLQGKGVKDRARYVADAMIECSSDPGVKSFLQEIYARDTEFAEGGYGTGGAWAPKGASAANGNRPFARPPYAGTAHTWNPGNEELSLPANYGTGRRQEFNVSSMDANAALRQTGCFDDSEFRRAAGSGQVIGLHPDGLMGLAVTLAWEADHFVKGDDKKFHYINDQPMKGRWQAIFKQMDCCCLRLLLGRSGVPK
jgi:hypothetical protein